MLDSPCEFAIVFFWVNKLWSVNRLTSVSESIGAYLLDSFVAVVIDLPTRSFVILNQSSLCLSSKSSNS